MTERRPLHERVVELVVYVPVGAALEIRERFSKVGQQVPVARWVGEMTVREARRRVAAVRSFRQRG